MSTEMIIFTRTYDFLKWLLPKAERFPKLYRNTVTQRLMDNALDFQEALYDAQAYTDKIRLRHLRRADAHLEKVRFYLRHLIIFPCRVSQAVVGEHKLEADAYGGAAALI